MTISIPSDQQCHIIILDIGNVLFTWSPQTSTTIPPRTLKDLTKTPLWGEFECGKVSEGECYRRLAEEHSLDLQELTSAFRQATESLKANDTFVDFIRELKTEEHGKLRVFAMSNISKPYFKLLRTKNCDWSIFDGIFTSGEVGMRKPTLGFYKHVLDAIGGDPSHAVFVDDKADNVLAARSLGMRGVQYTDQANVRAALRNLICDPTSRGLKYLETHAGQLESSSNTGVLIEENFSQLLIMELTKRWDLVNVVFPVQPGKWKFFRGDPVLTTPEHPCDFDTTAIGLTVLGQGKATAAAIMDEILQFLDEDGVIQTYFDTKRSRTDPVVCVNVLSLFYTYGRGAELEATQAWVLDVLKHRAYTDGTRYYPKAESFLFFLSRFLHVTSDNDAIQSTFRPLFRERVQELVGTPGDAAGLAMRIIACASVGIKNEVDLRRMSAMQLEDGSWAPGSLYSFGNNGIFIGNSGVATALALKAIEVVKGL